MQTDPVPLRVAFCDDAMGFPLLLTTWLEDMPQVQLVGSARTAADLLGLLPEAKPDVLLLDVMLPDGKISADLAAQVRSAVPTVRIVLMSSLGVADLTVEAESIGADAVWSKAGGSAALEAVVRRLGAQLPQNEV